MMMENAERSTIDDVIMPRIARARARALAMLRGKTVEMPGRKHECERRVGGRREAPRLRAFSRRHVTNP
jgi:hypothetical protein